jgi:hypothetical protein
MSMSVMNAGEFPMRSPALVPDQRDYEASSLMSIDPKRRRSITGAKCMVRLNGPLVPARGTNRE